MDRQDIKPFSYSLQQILAKTQMNKEIKIGQIILLLSGKGYAALLTLFSLPFCLPIQIPGFSTPFGLMLAFIGLRIAFGKHPWWPKWVLEKKIPSRHLETFLLKSKKIFDSVQKYLYPRFPQLTKNPILYRVHGLLIFFLSLLLSLPIPIPFTNMLAALPIFFMGLGLLEDDGLMIIIAYVLAILCFLLFAGLILFGKVQLTHLLSHF